MVQLLLGCKERHLPYLTFVAFAVAQNQIGIGVVFAHLQPQRHPCGKRSALPQRACTHVDAWRIVHIAMAGQCRAGFVKGAQQLLWEKPLKRQRRVEYGAAVAF